MTPFDKPHKLGATDPSPFRSILRGGPGTEAVGDPARVEEAEKPSPSRHAVASDNSDKRSPFRSYGSSLKTGKPPAYLVRPRIHILLSEGGREGLRATGPKFEPKVSGVQR